MKTITKTKTIAAPKEKVWSVLLEDEYNRVWFAEFMEGSHAETDWIVGHKVRFVDNSGGGVFGRIEEKQPYDIIHMVYEGIVVNGEDDTESAAAKPWIGTKEIYRLESNDEATVLHIEVDMSEEMYDAMSEAWDRALDKIEELSVAV